MGEVRKHLLEIEGIQAITKAEHQEFSVSVGNQQVRYVNAEHLRQYSETKWSSLLFAEAIARCCKHKLRKLLRNLSSKMQGASLATGDLYYKQVIHFLCDLQTSYT